MANKIKSVFIQCSIRLKIIVIVFGLILPVNIFLIYSTEQSSQIVFEQVRANTISSLNVTMNQLDKEIYSIESYFFELYDANANFNHILQGMNKNIDQHTLAKIALSKDFKKKIVTNYNTDGLFVYNQENDDLLLMMSENGKKREKNIQTYIKNSEGTLSLDAWQILNIDNECYLVRIYNKDGSFYGGFIILDNIEEDVLQQFEYDIAKVSFNHEQIPIIKETQMLFYSQSSSVDVFLNIVIEKKEIFQKLPFLQRYNYQLAFIMLLLIPILILVLNFILIKPLQHLNAAFKRIEGGEIDYRVREHRTSLEFWQINRSFNRMMDRIKDLEIENHEKELEKQTLELSNLQMQIHPHFLLNMLNLLFHLAQLQDHKSMQQMVTYLSTYLRHSFRNANKLTTIKEEMEFVKSYLSISHIRYEDGFEVIYQIESDVLEQKIPPMIIQNSVENIIKYTLCIGEKRNILIQSGKADGEICIRVVDDGEGIPNYILEMVNSNKPVIKDGKQHIGIWNCKKRLHMFYGDAATYSIVSGDGKGTIVEVHIPWG